MSKKIKIWLIAAASLIVVGLITFTAVMSYYRWDFSKLSRTKHQTATHEITQAFSSISIDTDTADVRFVLAQDGKCKIVCTEQENLKHTVVVENNELKVQAIDERKWYGHILNFAKNEVVAYLPLAFRVFQHFY